MTEDPARARRALLSWFDRTRRDLPWRGLDDPYAVWVSEVMLQQTRVDTVVPYFLRWMERFPDVASLAAAPREDVLRMWQGLGYYSRGRALHEAAAQVVAEHGGALPRSRDRLARLPGVGPYTAGAIASIAFGEPVPAVDGNVLRVLARVHGTDADISVPAGRAEITALAGSWVAAKRPGDSNQALMELGATVCTPRAPACPACPLRRVCRAFLDDRVEALPVRSPKRAPRKERMRFAWIKEEGRLLVTRAPERGLLGGLWALPGGPVHRPLPSLVREQTGLKVRIGGSLGVVDHRFTHRVWRIEVRRCRRIDDGSGGGTEAEWAWAPLDRLSSWPVATAHRKAMALAVSR